jgi:hypothetical protein
MYRSHHQVTVWQAGSTNMVHQTLSKRLIHALQIGWCHTAPPLRTPPCHWSLKPCTTPTSSPKGENRSRNHQCPTQKLRYFLHCITLVMILVYLNLNYNYDKNYITERVIQNFHNFHYPSIFFIWKDEVVTCVYYYYKHHINRVENGGTLVTHWSSLTTMKGKDLIIDFGLLVMHTFCFIFYKYQVSEFLLFATELWVKIGQDSDCYDTVQNTPTINWRNNNMSNTLHLGSFPISALWS